MAKQLGGALTARGYGLVYGGGKVGLMTVIADMVLGAGGHVTGVIPNALVSKEVAHRGLSDLRVVGSMHERKALMAELSDGFIGGGFHQAQTSRLDDRRRQSSQIARPL